MRVEANRVSIVLLHDMILLIFLTHGPLTMPVLAIGGEKSFGPMMAVVARAAATNVTGVVIAHAGHWVMEENPTDTVAAVTNFLQ